MKQQATVASHGIVPVECHYLQEGITTAFVIAEGNAAAIVDTSTARAAPYILDALAGLGLSGGNVEYIIVTHAHLDHCAGAPELAQLCPNATIICHPLAARHLIDPSRLVQGAKMLYGEKRFESIYGEIPPVDAGRIRNVADEEELRLGSRSLTFLHTRGHADHHLCVHDSRSGAVFTGDSFGLAYPMLQKGNRPFLYPATTPTDFDAAQARLSVRRITSLQPTRLYLAHYGIWEDIEEGERQMLYALDRIERIYDQARHSCADGKAMRHYCANEFMRFLQEEISGRNLELSPQQWELLQFDIEMNSLGVAMAAERSRIKESCG